MDHLGPDAEDPARPWGEPGDSAERTIFVDIMTNDQTDVGTILQARQTARKMATGLRASTTRRSGVLSLVSLWGPIEGIETERERENAVRGFDLSQVSREQSPLLLVLGSDSSAADGHGSNGANQIACQRIGVKRSAAHRGVIQPTHSRLDHQSGLWRRTDHSVSRSASFPRWASRPTVD